MIQILLIVHLLIALAMIGVVLLQRSEGGGLGIGGGGGGGGMGGFMTGRGTANVLTRTTAILAALFMLSSIGLAILTGGTRHSAPTSILDQAPPAASDSQAPGADSGADSGTGGEAGQTDGDSSTPSVPVQ